MMIRRGLVRSGLLGLGVLALLARPTPSFAYAEDTHFLITYVICRTTGFTHEEALTVAAVDQGMDDSPGAVANGGEGDAIPNVAEEWLWHALDRDGQMGAQGLLQRKAYLFQVALSQATPRDKLIYLGVYFHYQQDTWAHRHHYDNGKQLSMDAFTTYNTPTGHARDGNQPDRPPFDPVTAFHSLEDGCAMARIFLKQGLGRDPNAFFAGYQPFGGAYQDDNWTDRRKGKYFHMLGYSGGTPAQAFLCKLIQAQINAYPVSLDANPNYAFRETADNLNFETARTVLQGECDAAALALGFKFTIPSQQDKLNQGFTTLTTAGFPAAVPRQ